MRSDTMSVRLAGLAAALVTSGLAVGIDAAAAATLAAAPGDEIWWIAR